ncbi:hypothetical protein ACH4NO_18310 [Streptomyces olivaceus]|uniref:hypothetical protein n=1 Tax=Streptomyces olivaceus TaxID=47716 RepID=UPI00378B8E1D
MTEPATSPAPDRVTALYDAIDAFQRQHRTVGGLAHAQIRALLAEHLDAALPVPVDPAGLRETLAALHTISTMGECEHCGCSAPCPTMLAVEAAVLPATTRHDTDTDAEGVDRISSEDRRQRYATPLYAIMRQNGWDGERSERVVREMDLVLDAVTGVADAEQQELRAEMERRTLMLQASRDVAERLRADRAAVLREEADRLVAEVQKAQRHTPDDARLPGLLAAIEGLRRRADETAATETQPPHRPVALATPCTDCGHTYNWHTRRDHQCEAVPLGVGRCGCTGFVPGERPEPMDPRRILGADETAATETEAHVCKPGATVYYCPTSGETESDCHGGFDVCCARPDLHQPTDEACQQLAEKLDTVRACAEAWAWPSMSAPSRAAGEHLLRLLDAEPAAGARQDGAPS